MKKWFLTRAYNHHSMMFIYVYGHSMPFQCIFHDLNGETWWFDVTTPQTRLIFVPEARIRVDSWSVAMRMGQTGI